MSGSGIFGGKARPFAAAEHRPGTRPEVSTLEHTTRLWTPSQCTRQVALKSRSRTSFALLGRTSHQSGGDDIGPDRQRSSADSKLDRADFLSRTMNRRTFCLVRCLLAIDTKDSGQRPRTEIPSRSKRFQNAVQAFAVKCGKPLRCNGPRNSQSQICSEQSVSSGANRSARICCAGRNRHKR
jgi:hypothetical protein